MQIDSSPVHRTQTSNPVFVCFGWKKTAKEGALVGITVDDEKVRQSTEGIVLLSNPAHRRRESWWGGTLELPNNSIIHLVTKVGVRGAGPDISRSVDHTYRVAEDAPVVTVNIGGVGFRHYPLLKGRLKVLNAQSAHDPILSELESQLAAVEEL